MTLNSIFWNVLWWMTVALPCSATVFTNNFANDPSGNGWRVFGNTNLFRWNSTNQNLEVTWDSSQANSYFHQPLGTILGKSDDFSVALDVRLDDIAVGMTPGKPYSFPFCFGFQNFTNSTATNFFRGSGHTPNLAEFAYYPDSDYGATVWPSFWSTNKALNYNGPSDYTIIDLPVGVVMRITMNYTASNKTCVTTIATNGISIGTIHNVRLTNFTDLRVDTFAIESYSDAGQNPGDGGSLLAHGVVDNLTLTFPPPPVQDLRGAFANGQWQVQFTSRTNWNYLLERTQNFQGWTEVSGLTNGTGGNLFLPDTNAVSQGFQFYRVKSQRID